MAVDSTIQTEQQAIRDMWPRHQRRILIRCGIGVAIAAVATLIPVSILPRDTPLMWLGLLAGLVTTLVYAGYVVFVALRPLKSLTDAITHVSGEPADITPPSPTSDFAVQSGLAPALNLIYNLGRSLRPASSSPAITTPAIGVSMFDNAPIGIIVLDPAKRIVYYNKKAPVRVDHSNQPVIDLLFDDDLTLSKWLAQCDISAVHDEHYWKHVANKMHGEEGRVLYDMCASYDKGNNAEVIIALMDRTSEYGPEDEQLDFIAFAAHELRGPITVIRGYLDELSTELEPILQGDHIELMNRLKVSTNRLSSYVSNILNTSKYDRRHLRLRLSEDSIAAIYDTIRDDMDLRARSQQRILTVNLPTNLPTVAADRSSVSEVLSNLIDNAIKYSNHGGIISVTASHDSHYVNVSVSDNGIGIPSSLLNHLFHKFYRSHRSRETVGGTGIGLYICKAIVESHGGSISVRSTEGHGSIFTFSLPIYHTVADKIAQAKGGNQTLVRNDTGITNHGAFKG